MSKGEDLHVPAGTTFHLPCKVVLRSWMLTIKRVTSDADVEEDADADADADADTDAGADADGNENAMGNKRGC